jgi:hypothetical protein
MQLPLTPTLEVNATISDILRLLLSEEVSDVDRLLLISELESLLESLLANQFEINIEIEDDGNQKVLTITTTSTMKGLAEEGAPEEEEAEEEEIVREESAHFLYGRNKVQEMRRH